MQKLLWIGAVIACLLAISVDATAGQMCRGAMFTCSTRNETTTGDKLWVEHGKNLKQLIDEEARSLKWVLRHCGLLDRTPYNCDWQRNIRLRSVAGKLPPVRAAAPVQDQVKLARAVRRVAQRSPSVVPAPIRAPVNAAKKRPFDEHVRAAAARYKLPADFIAAVLTVESGANPKAVSHAGAQGLMQLMPDTAKAMGVLDPWDPAQNVMGGARFLRILANRFRGDLVKVLSAYHAGSTRVKQRQGTPFSQTDRYVRKVLRVYYALRDG
jgi:soluble lytic murein transglycosylase-like protein